MKMNQGVVIGLIGIVFSAGAFAAEPSIVVRSLRSGAVLFSKNADAVRPIASISKLFTAVAAMRKDGNLSCAGEIREEDSDPIKHTHSRLPVGLRLSCQDLMKLALVNSENRAAKALSRAAIGDSLKFEKAIGMLSADLGLKSTRLIEPSGLAPENVSSATDILKVMEAALALPPLARMSTMGSLELALPTKRNPLRFNNTNPLTRDGQTEVVLTKTGYIEEAGRNLAMVVQTEKDTLAMVILGASTSGQRLAIAKRIISGDFNGLGSTASLRQGKRRRAG